jgi:alkylation response protein AidB-like acyl-CoA dehydrogenase
VLVHAGSHRIADGARDPFGATNRHAIDMFQPGAIWSGRGAELVLTSARTAGRLPAETARTSTSFTIFEGTSEIQRMIIGRAVTGLDVR